jgi:hypothetical protein
VKGKTGCVGSHLSYRDTWLAVQVVEDREIGIHRVRVHPDNGPEVEDSAVMQGPLISDTEERERAAAVLGWPTRARGGAGESGLGFDGPTAAGQQVSSSFFTFVFQTI